MVFKELFEFIKGDFLGIIVQIGVVGTGNDIEFLILGTDSVISIFAE